MSFLAPWAFAIGVAAALAAVALHLLSTRRPPRAVLPTARFVPESEARAVSRSSRPTDLLLLACRVLAALSIGAAFARPVPDAPGASVRTVYLVDVSSAVDAPAAVRLGIAEAVDEGDAVVVFDTATRVLPRGIVAAGVALGAMDSSQRVPAPARGILSAALVAGAREARRVARGADSVRLMLVSPLVAETFDAATASARAEWPGGIRLVRPSAVSDTALGGTPQLDTPLADDALAPALAALDAARGAHAVRFVRRAPSAADTAWAREAGRVLVHWPHDVRAAVVADAVTAFGLEIATVVAPLARLSGVVDTSGRIVGTRVVARWRDGSVAAIERSLGEGCVRDVAVGVPLAGDLTLRPSFHAFAQVLVEPCGGARGRAVSDSVATAFAGGDAAVAARTLVTADATDATLAAWLLAAALAALVVEWLVRSRRSA